MSDELTIEQALAELRAIEPDLAIHVTDKSCVHLNDSFDERSTESYITIGKPLWLEFKGANLTDCMAQVRAWHTAQATTTRQEEG